MCDTGAMFNDYLNKLPEDDCQALERLISIVQELAPQVSEGLSYGMPAFIYKDRPLVGFSSNKKGLSLYPYDPRLLAAIASELQDYEVDPGVIRFSPERSLSKEVISLVVSLRLESLK